MAASVKEVETCPLIHPSVRTGAPSPQGEGLWAVRNIPGRAGDGTRPYGMCRSILSFRRGRTLAGPRERQAPPLRRFACKWNGASGRPRPTNIEPSIVGGHMGTPLRRIERRLRSYVGAGHWPARRRDFAISEPTLIRLACARHLIPGRETAFGRLIAAPTNKGERPQNRAGG